MNASISKTLSLSSSTLLFAVAMTVWLTPRTDAGIAAVRIAQKDEITEVTKEATDSQKPTKPKKPSSRIYLTNGDKLSGLPESIDDEQRMLFKSESLRQTAAFPLANVLALNLDTWKESPKIDTIARIELQSRFRETHGDTILGELKELTPDSIKLNTWYGGEITLKRSMVKSLKIISNAPGNYYGPNGIQEWEVSGGTSAWDFQHGSLISHASGGVGKDVGLREKSHISFDAKWQSSMRFKFRVYSSDVTDTTPSAYYEISINRSYAYMRTRGKSARGARILGGGRWKQIASRPEGNQARFDFFINRTTGSVTIYINNLRACMLQSQNPDPENLGTGLSFHSEDRYPIEISGITVTPWNGTTLPKPKAKATAEKKDGDADDDKSENLPPHRIVLNNGDEVPGTVGKVEDGRMVIETEYTPIRIPIKRIKSLNLGDSGEEPKKYREDIRAWFHSGGFVTLKLDSFKDGEVSGYSQALGDVTFDLSAFSRIDFHIYDDEANETRKKIRF
ncbi:MAG: hypothetical protein KJO79_02600 [Verrucomicrobiae bacterium]|nr:hypothetical protein [Verrucomicrobiae bacterium]NNJ86044.1 hypothetical protein [Akkermansiaceae bacterium]